MGTDSTDEGTRTEPFGEALRRAVRLTDLLVLVGIAGALVAVHALKRGTRESLAFDTTAPTVATAFTSHFVHLTDLHLIGNLAVYVPAVSIAYLLCVLSGRRQLFLTALVTLLVVFPFALSGLQLVFPRERLIYGFSGITAGIVGLAGFALVGYLRETIAPWIGDEYAPAILFAMTGATALIALPDRAWRVEIGLGALALGAAYAGGAARGEGLLDRARMQAALGRPGYPELAGTAAGLLVGYPFVAFQEAVVPGGGVVDVYVHLLGYALAFIVVFAFVFLSRVLEDGWQSQSDGYNKY